MRITDKYWSILLILGVFTGSMIAPIIQAQTENTPPLVIVALPDATGEALTALLQHNLNSIEASAAVRQYGGPANDEAAAARLARLYQNIPVVVWLPEEAPESINITRVRNWPFTPNIIVTDTLPAPQNSADLVALTRLLAGEALIMAGQCEIATPTLKRGIEHNPDNWPGTAYLRYHLAACYAIDPDPEARAAAIPELQQATAATNEWYMHYALAWALSSQNRPNEALTAMTAAIETGPDRLVDLYFDRAQFAESLNDSEAALSDYAAILERQPDNAEALRRRSQLYIQTAAYGDAAADLTSALDYQTDNPYLWLERAKLYTLTGAYQLALDDITTGLALEPFDQTPFILQRGLIALYTQDFAAAVTDLRDYTGLRPSDAAGWIDLGQAHEGLGETFSAIQAYETALSTDPTTTYLYSTLARLAYEGASAFDPGSPEATNQLLQTTQLATDALAEYAADTTALLYRALAYIALEDLPHALEDLSAALEIDPNFLPAVYNRAIVYARLGNQALDGGEYEQLYRAALDDYALLFQADFETYNYLLPYAGYLYFNLGDYEASIEHFEDYAALYPGAELDQYGAAVRAHAYHEQGHDDKALIFYQQAINGDSARYTCEAALQSGLILGRQQHDPGAAAEALGIYLAQTCTTNPVMQFAVRTYQTGWENIAP